MTGSQEKFCGWKLPPLTRILQLLQATTGMLSRNMVIHERLYVQFDQKNCAGLPRLVRADRGTENAKVAYLHPFLRRDIAGTSSFQYGRSVSNQVSMS